jgi:hypothetical protein
MMQNVPACLEFTCPSPGTTTLGDIASKQLTAHFERASAYTTVTSSSASDAALSCRQAFVMSIAKGFARDKAAYAVMDVRIEKLALPIRPELSDRLIRVDWLVLKRKSDHPSCLHSLCKAIANDSVKRTVREALFAQPTENPALHAWTHSFFQRTFQGPCHANQGDTNVL